MPQNIDTIELTQAHIDAGEPGDSDNCPIWHAIRDAYEADDEVEVFTDHTEINLMPYRHSPTVEKWILRYDDLRMVKPVTLIIDHPNLTIKIKR